MATDSEEAVDVAEDLVLENSPLDQYLKELGMSEFASYSALDGGEIFHKSQCRELLSNTPNATRLGQPHHGPKSFVDLPCKSLVSTFILFMIRYVVPIYSTNLRKPLETVLALFSNSKILYDVEKLQQCSTVVESVIEKSAESSRTGDEKYDIKVNFIGKMLDSTSFHVLFICILMGVLFGSLQSITTFGAALLMAVVLVMLLAISYMWFIRKQAKKLSVKTVQLTKIFISNFEAICRTLDKSFLLVRECEVISQGYTFYHPGLPSLASGSRKRGSCVTLREAIMENSLKLFEIIASIAKQLMGCLPRDLRLIYSEDGIFNINPGDLRSSVVGIGWTGKEMPDTDLIRSMIWLIRSELIELFQIIQLLIAQHLTGGEEGNNTSSDLQNLLNTLKEIYSNNNATVSNILDDVGSKLSFTKEHEFKENMCDSKPSFSLPSSPVQIKIDSAFLHLKSAIGHLECFESMLPNILESNGSSEIDDELSEKVKSFANVFNHEIASARECVDDINKSLSSKVDGTSGGKCQVLSKSEAPEQNLDVKLFDCDSPAQQEGDLLLEGISEPPQYKDEFVEADESLMDEKRLKEQLIGSSRLIKELKAIFSYKKSPAGLVPLDLVKEKLNIDGTVEEVMDGVVTEQSVSVNELGTRPSHDVISRYEVDTSLHRRGDQGSMEWKYESNMNVGVVPPRSMLNDLKCALLQRQRQGLSNESMIESDTFEFDVDESNQNES